MSKDVLIPKAQFFKTLIAGTNRNMGLDIVRALSILGIFLAHTNNYAGKYTGIYKILFPLGYLGQDLFFCLSGFLIGRQIIKYMNTPNKFKGLMAFYRNRWIRTVPFYLVFLAINYLVFRTVYRYSDLVLFKDTSFSIFNYLTFTQNFNSPHPTFFPEIWPLPVEEWSFLLIPVPVLILAAFSKKTLSVKHLFLLLLIEIAAVSLYRLYYIILNEPEMDWELRKIVVYRFDALLYGFMIRVLSDHYADFFTKHKTGFLISGLVLAFGFYFSKPYLPVMLYESLFFNIVPIGMSLTMPYFYFSRFTGWPQGLRSLVTHISLSSYAALLCHLYLVQFSLLNIYVPQNLGESVLFTMMYVLLVIAISTLFFNYVERPVLIRRKKL